MIAAVLEVAWVASMRLSEGYTKFWPSVVSIALVISDVYILGVVFKVIPTSIGYPIWVGLGIVGSVLIGCLAFKDQVGFAQILFISVILIGIVGLKTTA